MITLLNGFPQGANGLIVPNGSITFQLNVDGTVIAAPGGFVAADVEITFQFNSLGQIEADTTGTPAQLYSNAELNPQNSIGLGTYYLVTFYDQNGARLNRVPMWWQFPEASGATVDISQITPIATVGGNVIFYPTSFLAGVSSVTFTGDGTVLSSTPSLPVTSTGTLTATLNKQAANTILAGPTSGGDAAPTFRALVVADLPSGYAVWSNLENAAADLTLANTTFNTTFNQTSPVNWLWANITAATSTLGQSSPTLILEGQRWTGSVSAPESWSLQTFLYRGSVYALTAASNASGGKTIYTVDPANANPLPPLTASIQVAGFTSSVNNGTFTVADNRSGLLTLNNASGVNESHAATATVLAGVVESSAFVIGHPLGGTSQILIAGDGDSLPDLGWVTNPQMGFTNAGSSQLSLSVGGGIAFLFSTVTVEIGTQNLAFSGLGQVISGTDDPHTTYTLTAAANAAGGNTSYTGTFSPVVPVGGIVNISGFTNGGNNVINALVVSCDGTHLVVVNAGGVLETHAAIAGVNNSTIFIGGGGRNTISFTACLGFPQTAYDPPTAGTFTSTQRGRAWFNTNILKYWDGVDTCTIPGRCATSLLTAQSAAITATTLYAIPAGAAGFYRVTYSATVTTVSDGSSTLGGATGFQVKYTNANGDSVVKTTAAPVVSSNANTTGTAISGEFVVYAAASTNLQYLIGYTDSHSVTGMAFDLAISAEYLGS